MSCLVCEFIDGTGVPIVIISGVVIVHVVGRVYFCLIIRIGSFPLPLFSAAVSTLCPQLVQINSG